VAFRLLVERHQPMVRARAAGLCANASDVDDIMQEAFLRAFIALDRLREPDRFAGWLAGIVLNVCRGLRRRDPITLLPDSPEPPPASAFSVQPASSNGQPSADDLDRADALREAMATLPAGQRRAVFLHYYAGLPAGQIGDQAGVARVSLHKARRRLREYLTEHRPDLVPRRLMTTVRIASAEHQRRRIHQTRSPSHLVVLIDDAGGRELPIWMLRGDGDRLERLVHAERGEASAPQTRTADDLTSRMLRAIGATVTGVDIDELGPEVTAARIALNGPAGPQEVTARLADGLAAAITTGAPVRVADAVMDRLAVPAGSALFPDPGPAPLPAAQHDVQRRAGGMAVWRQLHRTRQPVTLAGLHLRRGARHRGCPFGRAGARRVRVPGPDDLRRRFPRLDGGVPRRVPRPGGYPRTRRAVPPGQRGACHHGPDDRTVRVRRPRQQHHPDPGRRRLDPA
jgi:RNA polymerase sigma factor (sigma-70 family)